MEPALARKHTERRTLDIAAAPPQRVLLGVANLSPDDAQKVLEVLEKAMKRRRIQLLGYLVAAFVLVVGMIGALYYYGSQEGEGFVGWAFLIPLGLCGVVLIAFGKWSERYRTALEDRFEAEQRRKKA